MIELFTTAFITLAVIIDPPGCAPIFASLTSGTDAAHRRRMAFRSVAVAWSILIFFALLGEQTKGAGGEIQLTDAMQILIRTQDFTGVKYEGRAFDCGSKIGFLTANVVFALDRPDIAPAFMKELRDLAAGSD